MDRFAVFVDAGYLFAAGGELCCDTRGRRNLQLDAEGFTAWLASKATERCGLSALRTYWYDGARQGIATVSQQVIAALPNVKLRLGRLNARNEQKGVDALIYRDLMTLARERAITEAWLLSGDEDLREGVRSAQDMGIRVTLLGIPPVSQDFNQSRELVDEADEIDLLHRTDLLPYFRLAQPELPMQQVVVERAELDIGAIEAAGKTFAATWSASASEADVLTLTGQRPRIPKYLDVELLRHAEKALVMDLRGRDDAHRALRRGFWSGIPTLSPAREPNEQKRT